MGFFEELDQSISEGQISSMIESPTEVDAVQLIQGQI